MFLTERKARVELIASMPTGEPGSGGPVDHPHRPRDPPLVRVLIAPGLGVRPRIVGSRADGEDTERREHREAERVLLARLRCRSRREDREFRCRVAVKQVVDAQAQADRLVIMPRRIMVKSPGAD